MEKYPNTNNKSKIENYILRNLLTMEDILEVIRFLAAPYDEDTKDSFGEMYKAPTATSLWLELCEKVWTKVPMTTATKLLIEDPESSSTWKLTCTILDVLGQLRCRVEEIEKVQSEEENTIEILSVQSQSCILVSIELVVGFGVLPYLLPGVGIPNKFRKSNPAAQSILEEDKKLPHLTQFNHLAHVIQVLMGLCVHPTFANLIISKSFNDILAGLLQICKPPIAKPVDVSQIPKGIEIKKTVGSLTIEQYEAVMTKRKQLDDQFNTSFMKTVPKVMLVKSLLLIGAVQKPKWIMISCNSLVHTVLFDRHGLAIISQAVAETLESAKSWQISKVVSNLLLDSIKSKEDSENVPCLSNLCSQCVELIRVNQEGRDNLKLGSKVETSKDWHRIGLFCATTITNINNELAQTKIWNLVFRPVMAIFQDSNHCSPSATEIEVCADIAQTLLCLSIPADINLPINKFHDLWSMLLHILVACERYLEEHHSNQVPIVLRIRSKIVEVISLLLEIVVDGSKEGDVSTSSTHNQSSACHFVVELIISLITDKCKAVNIKLGPNNGNSLSSGSSKADVQFHCIQYHAKESHELINLVCSMFSKKILPRERFKEFRSQLFCQLLTYKSNRELTKVSQKNPFADEKYVVLMLMDVLAADDESILENCARVNNEEEKDSFKFLELIAIKLLDEMESSQHSGESYEFNQSLSYFLGILGTLCESNSSFGRGAKSPEKINEISPSTENSLELWGQLEKFMPYLKRISEQKGAEETVVTAKNILTCIETRGKVCTWNQCPGNKKETISRYEKALQDVSSLLLAVKGHGILELRRLIEEDDSNVVENEQTLLNLFQKELRNDDSYVYLMAINGMAALGHRCHAVVIPILIDLYGFDDGDKTKGTSDKNASTNSTKMFAAMTAPERLELRLKIGEILVKVIQKLGVEIAPLYRVSITNVCFRLLRDDDEIIRASALSNLGELCQVLQLALGNVLSEVWFTVENLLESEQSCQVRRAALHLMVLLLRGVARELQAEFLIVNRDVGMYIRDARRLLVKLRGTETDPTALTHIQLALDEITYIAAKFFMLPAQNTP